MFFRTNIWFQPKVNNIPLVIHCLKLHKWAHINFDPDTSLCPLLSTQTFITPWYHGKVVPLSKPGYNTPLIVQSWTSLCAIPIYLSFLFSTIQLIGLKLHKWAHINFDPDTSLCPLLSTQTFITPWYHGKVVPLSKPGYDAPLIVQSWTSLCQPLNQGLHTILQCNSNGLNLESV